ncbi:MAG: MFS transporter [Planctomycetes bacterium]|nr:MFS transporter [Planctomycetota bacterium]
MPSPARRPSAAYRTAALRADLRRCTIDGVFYCVMVGIAEMYFAKFVSFLGLGPLATGLIATVPMVLGAAFGIPGQSALRRVGSFPKFVAAFATLQASVLIPMAALALFGPMYLPYLREHGLTWVLTVAVFTLATLYFAGSLGPGAAWMTLVGIIFPARLRASYFAHRSRLQQGATLGGLVLHGVMADGIEKVWSNVPALAGSRFDPALTTFAAAFLIGGVCRAVSAANLLRYSEAAMPPSQQQAVGARELLRRFSHGNDGKFILYALCGGFALQIGQPFVNPFVLGQLQATGVVYKWASMLGTNAPYSLLLAAVYLGRVLSLPWAGRMANRWGSVRLLWIGGLMLPPMALFWLWTSDFGVLLLGQIATGAALAIWDLGVFLMNYESVHPRERTAMITYYTFMNEAAKTSGSLAGGAVLDGAGAGHGAYAVVFWVSAAARVLTLGLLTRVRRPGAVAGPRERADIAAAEEGDRLTIE